MQKKTKSLFFFSLRKTPLIFQTRYHGRHQDFMAKLPDQTVITLPWVINLKIGILVYKILQKYHDFSWLICHSNR